MKLLKRASVGLLAAVIAVGPFPPAAQPVATLTNHPFLPSTTSVHMHGINADHFSDGYPDDNGARGQPSFNVADRSLRDYRGERIVLLVLYSLPGSRPRIADLAVGSDALELEDVEVIFAPTDADPDANRRLGPDPRLQVGDEVEFTVRGLPPRVAITAMEKISRDESPGTPAPGADC